MTNFNKIIEQYREIARSKTDVGDRFEHLIKRYLLSYQVYGNDKIDKVWLWNEWPFKNQFGGHDTGIDLIALTNEGGYWAIQCKCYDAETIINKAEVDSFLATSGKTWKDDNQLQCTFKLCVFVSTTNKWSKNADSAFKNRTTDFLKINLADLEKSPVNWVALSKGSMGAKVLTEPYSIKPHQQEALDKVHEYFKTNDRGKLIMACGTGKTFTALRIAEHETGVNGFVLFLVPSISLLRQVFLEWRNHKKSHINFVWICSDPTASRTNQRDEELNYDISDLPWKATTDDKQIHDNLTTCLSKPGMTVVFSTYQSIDVVNKVQVMIDKQFDLIICDEAHRTTGVTLPDQADESNFIKIHNPQFIQGKKRLYMTATPLIYHDKLKTKLEFKNYPYISMDNKVNYGAEIHSLSFGEAVEQKLLTNYKLMTLTIDKKDLDPDMIEYLLKNKSSLKSDDNDYENNIMKLLGCINALKKAIVDNDEAKALVDDPNPMQRAVAFCGSIQDSKDITALFDNIHKYKLSKDPKSYVVSAKHMDGTMPTVARDELLEWLETDLNPLEVRMLTNVRCLNEGIDVPALDAVLFLSPRSSKIDIVQSIGRVMRKSPGKKFGYIIIPVIVDNDSLGDEIFNKNYPEYKDVWDVVNALLAHDESFNNEISKLAFISSKYKKYNRLIIGRVYNDTIQINNADDQFNDYYDSIKAKIIPHNYFERFWLRWVEEIKQVYESQKQQIKSVIDADNNFRQTFDQYYDFFKTFNENLLVSEFIEMIAQRVVMWPVFEALLENNEAQDNIVNTNLNAVLKQLAITNKISDADQKKLTKFYESIKLKTQDIDDVAEKQQLIKEIYNRFFKIAFPEKVKKLGIVYTPIEVVDFIVKSVADLLPIHFNNTTINDHGVYITDPFTGTGSFIVRLLENNLIKPEHLLHKYSTEIYASEITLLAYYVASINIVNSFYKLKVPGVKGSYTNFWGMRLLDTFQATEKNYHNWDNFYKTFYKKNIPIEPNRPPITIMIGNPPYSAKQNFFDDQLQNTFYKNLNQQIHDTYVKESSTSNNVSLYDSYYKAFRWSTDRLHPEGGGL